MMHGLWYLSILCEAFANINKRTCCFCLSNKMFCQKRSQPGLMTCRSVSEVETTPLDTYTWIHGHAFIAFTKKHQEATRFLRCCSTSSIPKNSSMKCLDTMKVVYMLYTFNPIFVIWYSLKMVCGHLHETTL